MEPIEYKKLLTSQKQIILQGPPGTGKTRIAKIIAINMINDKDNQIGDNATNDEIKKSFNNLMNAKLIQFHPSYSYEDFVRGITATTTAADDISYVVENKVLAQMAQEAETELISKKYYDAETKEERKIILKNKDTQKYILIIDEINRANLSSVLGELIYALEYRDEAVESMYALKKDKDGKDLELKNQREIILPSNFYIIGTMNTADRSVGSIDYALRRRFTFVDILPLDTNNNVTNQNSKYEKVSDLFDENNGFVSPEFNAKDVRLGHSYFIGNDDKIVEDKFKYQVLPILEEYVKDGVLIDKDSKKIKDAICKLDSNYEDNSSE